MGNIKTRWVGLGGIVFSEESPYPVIRDYKELLPYIEKLEHDLSVANRTINQYANETIKLQTEYDKLDSVVYEIARMSIPVKSDPSEGRRVYLGLCFKMRDIARKATGEDYTVRIENGFTCGPDGCNVHKSPQP